MPKRNAQRQKIAVTAGSFLLKLAVTVAVSALVLVAVYCVYLALEVDARFSQRLWNIPSRFYSDSMLLHTGQRIPQKDILEKLRQLGYREVTAAPQRTGEYRHTRASIEVYLHDIAVPDEARNGFPARITFAGNTISDMRHSGTRKKLQVVELEPEEITQYFGADAERRQPVALKEISKTLTAAVLAAEDNHFYTHPGLDPVGIIRALLVNLLHGAVLQGGSTITQQLVKNFFLSQERTLSRKIKEALMALIIEGRYTKDQILELYLNEIYLGQKGSASINGIGEASRFYFGKHPRALTLSESAVIAGLIKAPNHYSPFTSAERCRKRRDAILGSMHDNSIITDREYQDALRSPIQTIRYQPTRNKAPYFCDYLYEQFREQYPPDVLASMGLSLYTTLDTQVQSAAEKALERGLNALEKSHPELCRKGQAAALQGALIVVHPRTGAVLALVGGRNYGLSQFNRITHARRQPGSAFKPFVFLSALDLFSPSTLLHNEHKTYLINGKTWDPQNYEPVSEQLLTMRAALARSVNRAAIDLAMHVGLEQVIMTARAFAITTPLKPYPSLAIGAFEVIPLELARAYCAFASGGVLPQLVALKKVTDENGKVITRRHMSSRRVISPEKAFIMNSLLRSVVTEGTARHLAAHGFSFPAAGKTGTTNDSRDAWFVGYTPDVLCLVWVGFDDGRSIRGTGASAALPIWADILKAIPQHVSGSWYDMPEGVLEVEVCSQSGSRATPECPNRYAEVFLANTLPADYCSLHQKKGFFKSVIKGLNRLFKR